MSLLTVRGGCVVRLCYQARPRAVSSQLLNAEACQIPCDLDPISSLAHGSCGLALQIRDMDVGSVGWRGARAVPAFPGLGPGLLRLSRDVFDVCSESAFSHILRLMKIHLHNPVFILMS